MTTPRVRSPKRTGRISAVASLADQLVSSGLNFVALLVAAHQLSLEDFGRASLAVALFVAILNVGRSVVGELVLISDASDTTRFAAATSTALAVGCGFALLLFGSSWFLSDKMQILVLGVGLASPGFLLQDALRYVSFRANRHWQALRSDVLWTLFALSGFMIFPAADELGFINPVSIWLGSATLAAIIEVVLRFDYRKFSWSPSSLWDDRPLVRAYLGDSIVALSVNQAVLALLAVTTSFEVVGAVRGVVLLFGPIGVLFSAAYVLAVPRLQALDSDDGAATTLGIERSVSLGLCALATVLWALYTWTSIGSELLSDVWSGARPLLGWGWAATMALALGGGPMMVLRAQRRQGDVARTRAMFAPLQIALIGIGAYLLEGKGFFGGQMIALVLLAVAYWRLRRRDTPEASAPTTISADTTDSV